jgi:protein SERAC1
MWLCDSLPSEIPGTRIVIYGYDAQLYGSHTFQDLEALASLLRIDLQALATRESSDVQPRTKPLVFVAHSLGGLLVKEAMIQMKHDKNSQVLLDSIYGALFFGVPNEGMEISSLIPMVKGQPNQALLHSLGKESQILRNQCREFPKAFGYPDSEIVCFYETEMSPTAVWVSSMS